MGVIQGSINNLLLTAGAAARVSPTFEKMRDLEKTKKAYGKTATMLEESGFEANTEKVAKEQTERAQKIAEAEPTEANIRNFVAESENLESFDPEVRAAETSLIVEKQRKAEEKAAQALALEQERAQKSKGFRRRDKKRIKGGRK